MKRQDMRVKVDGYTRFCLGAIAVLLTVLVIGLWADGTWSSRVTAADGFMDAGAQRVQMIKVMEEQNTKLGELITLLKSGQAKVQVVDAEGKPTGGANAGAEK